MSTPSSEYKRESAARRRQCDWVVIGVVVSAVFALAVVPAAGGVSNLATGPEGVELSWPDPLTVEANVERDWSTASRLLLTVDINSPDDRPRLPIVRMLVYLQNRDGWWYQTVETSDLKINGSRTLAVDLRPDSTDWAPRGHFRPWDGRVLSNLRFVGIKIFSDEKLPGKVIIHKPRVTFETARNSRIDRPGGRLTIVDLETPGIGVVGETVDVRFRTRWEQKGRARRMPNPFDATQVDIRGKFTSPSGVRRVVPAFFSQDFVPVATRDSGDSRRGTAGRLVPTGPPGWRLRYRSDEPGRHECVITVAGGSVDKTIELAPVTFTLRESRRAHGRGGEGRGRYRETPASTADSESGGDFIIPLDKPLQLSRFVDGCWRAVPDDLLRDYPHGSTGWRAPIEWTADWGGYAGLGRYNLELARRIDLAVSDAERRGLSLPFALNDDEAFGFRAKFNWPMHPLNGANGGPLDAASEYFTDDEARRRVVNRMRYAIGRWGCSPAVRSWVIAMTVPGRGAESWHDAVATELAPFLTSDTPLFSRHPQAVEPLERRMPASSGEPLEWQWARQITSQRTDVGVENGSIEGRTNPLRLAARFPGEAAIYTKLDGKEADWFGSDMLSMDVYLTPNAPRAMRAMVYLRDADWWWYEALHPSYLRRGDWTRLLFDLSGSHETWQPVGHSKPWDGYAAQHVREIGLRLFGHNDYTGPVFVDNIQLWRTGHRGRQEPLRVESLALNNEEIPRFGKFEASFKLSRVFANPYDPDVADISATFVSPSGEETTVPAFRYQGFERSMEDEREELIARGAGAWKVRFAPDETGAWRFSLMVNGRRLPATDEQTFSCVASNNPGYVRRSKDSRYLEFSDGSFYYPIGMNLRSPSDGRLPYKYSFDLPKGRGTFIYDDYLDSMEKAGMNWMRLWMSPWWCALEWRGDWYGFHGVGRYNQQNAWRIDYILEQCEKRGIYTELALTNHGQFSTSVDEQWGDNPYNTEHGGMLESPEEFFHPETPSGGKANRKFHDRLRYIFARWGYSPSIINWSLFTETEFTDEYWTEEAQQDKVGNYHNETVARWHEATAGLMKKLDPFDHMVSTHFSHPWRGSEVWEQPELDLVVTNAYSAYPLLGKRGEPEAIRRFYKMLERFDRPILIGEFGGHWIRTPEDVLDHELHSGLWASATTPLAGATGFWWWLHVHFEDRYNHFKALSDFMKGEDLRNQGLGQRRYRAGSLRAQSLQNSTRAYIWVYDPRFDIRCRHNWGPVTWEDVDDLDDVRATTGAVLTVSGLRAGNYHVEFWDTYNPTGEPFDARELTIRKAHARIKLPTVKNDLAVKVKFVER